MNTKTEATASREHFEKYDALAHWLGWNALAALVPFPPERVRAALQAGDEHLNTLSLVSWDRKHGYEPDKLKPEVCSCCGQVKPVTARREAGVWGLVRAAIKRDREAGRTPLVTAWSLSDTVCVLKHVAKCAAQG